MQNTSEEGKPKKKKYLYLDRFETFIKDDTVRWNTIQGITRRMKQNILFSYVLHGLSLVGLMILFALILR